MLLRIIIFILGIFLTSVSILYFLLYLNMINMGYTFLEFVNFIIREVHMYLIFIGIAFIILSLKKGK